MILLLRCASDGRSQGVRRLFYLHELLTARQRLLLRFLGVVLLGDLLMETVIEGLGSRGDRTGLSVGDQDRLAEVF